MFRAAYFLSRRLRHSAFFIEGRRLDLTGRTWWQSLPKGVGQGFVYAVLLGPYLVMDGLVTRKLRAVLGGKFRATVSGGGALPQHVDEFFNYIGIPVLEGYGMTETSPVLAVRTWRKRVIGTVGPAWKETEIRIASLETGEILYPDPDRPDGGRGMRGEVRVRGPQVMSGYYKDPELTAKVFKDGWLCTGDIGLITFNDCLKLVGRAKETIVLLSGENVEPVPIENKLCESPYIDQCMVVGQDQKNLAALIVTDPAHFEKDGIDLADLQALNGNADVERIINREIKTYVSRATGFHSNEMIHAWRLLPKAFEVGDELTATYKLKRHVIENVHRDLISEIYRAHGRDERSREI
jgi:long-chain acyl-CoA synthetase